MDIMFRIWDKRNNKWLDDESIYINKNGQVCELQAASYGGDTWLDSKIIDHRVEVNIFTGLYDEKLNPIYEGDILKVDNGKYSGVVKFNEHDLSFVIENRDGGFGFVNGQIFDERPEYRTYEVIGNKYENPELL